MATKAKQITREKQDRVKQDQALKAMEAARREYLRMARRVCPDWSDMDIAAIDFRTAALAANNLSTAEGMAIQSCEWAMECLECLRAERENPKGYASIRT